MVVVAVIFSILVCLAIDYFVRFSPRTAAVAVGGDGAFAGGAARASSPGSGGTADLLRIPAGVFLTKGHTWMRLERSGAVQVGAGQLPLCALGPIDGVETAPEGSRIESGDVIAVLKHGDRQVSLRSPVSGTVKSVRGEALDDPGCVEPGTAAGSWLCTVAPRGLPTAIKEAFVAEEAKEWMRGEVARLRDFLSGIAARQPQVCATLADGGLPRHGLAELVTADQWHEFVTRFFEDEADDVSDHARV